MDVRSAGRKPFLMAKGEMDPRTRQPKRLEALTNAERRAIDILLADKRSEQSDYRHSSCVGGLDLLHLGFIDM